MASKKAQTSDPKIDDDLANLIIKANKKMKESAKKEMVV